MSARDLKDQPVILLEKEWDLNWLRKENPEITFATALG
jgi:peptide chain release factor 3